VYAVVKRYRERGDIENRPRSGRKKKLDDRDTRKLSRLVKNNSFSEYDFPASKFRIMIVFTSDDKSFDFPIAFVYARRRLNSREREDVVSSVTVKRCLYRNDFHRRVVRKNIRIREANVRGHLAWAQGKRYSDFH
jgi:hypothetical protein